MRLHNQKLVPPALALAALLLAVCTGSAATFTVTTTADSGPGSLRQAILDANADASPGAVLIGFNIPGTGVQTIAPLSTLPYITRPVTIDGYTQPGTSPNTLAQADNAVLLIELNGINLNSSSSDRGLFIKASNCTVRGLVINRFVFENSAALWVEGNWTNTVIEGNFMGTDATGMNPQPNVNAIALQGDPGHRVGGLTPAARNIISGNGYGIFFGCASNLVLGNFIGIGADGITVVSNTFGIYIHNISYNQVGGTAPGARNIISGNQNGVWINNKGSNVFQGNYIGTDASGTLARGNLNGITLNDSPSNLIGGTGAGEGNLVSGNDTGLNLNGLNATNNLVLGNLIGTDATGTLALGNHDYGVFAGVGNLIGGITANAGNVITGGRIGVAVYGSAATNTSVLGNSIFGNSILGIDLGFDTWTATLNDPSDADEGANHLQNYPDITSSSVTGPNMTVDYRVDSAAANSAYPLMVEFFIADRLGQGQTFIHRATYSTPQTVDHITFVPVVTPTSGDKIVATATDANGNTSEFSALTTVTIYADTSPPQIMCPPNVTVTGQSEVPPVNFAGGSASDNSGSVSVAHLGDSTVSSCGGVITRTYQATDPSGNTAQCQQTITVLPQLVFAEERVSVHYHDSIAPGATADNRGYSKARARGEIHFCNPGMIPQDLLSSPNATTVGARVKAILAGKVIADQTVTLQLQGDGKTKWEFVSSSGPVSGVKIHWEGAADFTSASSNPSSPRMDTEFIGLTSTELRFETKPGTYATTLPSGVSVTVTNGKIKSVTGLAADSYEINSNRKKVDLTLPFRLVPGMQMVTSGSLNDTVTATAGVNYTVAEASYLITIRASALPQVPLFNDAPQTLTYELTLGAGAGQHPAFGRSLIGTPPKAWDVNQHNHKLYRDDLEEED